MRGKQKKSEPRQVKGMKIQSHRPTACVCFSSSFFFFFFRDPELEEHDMGENSTVAAFEHRHTHIQICQAVM